MPDPDQGAPGMVVNSAAKLGCGCGVYVGLRVDNRELATAAGACSADHAALVNDFNVRLLDSLDDPQARPLVDVCVELLSEAEAEFLAS